MSVTAFRVSSFSFVLVALSSQLGCKSSQENSGLSLSPPMEHNLLDDFQFVVGDPELLFSSDQFPEGPDSHFAVIQSGPEDFKGYTANLSTLILRGPSVFELSLDSPPKTVMPPNENPQAFDGCGRWLEAAFADRDLVRAFYHAETACQHSQNFQTHKSAGIAISRDGGETFDQYAKILSDNSTPIPGAITGEGDISVVNFGGYYYMYFLNAGSGDLTKWYTGVARSSIEDGGLPGTWKKFYEGSFSTDAIGGRSSPVAPFMAASAGVSMSTDEVLVVSPFGVDDIDGISISTSKNGIDFRHAEVPLIPFLSHDWNRKPDSKEWIAYLSILSPKGERRFGQNFILAYSFIRPGEGFDRRHQVLRKVSLVQRTEDDPVSLLTLTRYHNNADHWVTTTLPSPGYGKEFSLGYILTARQEGTIPLYDLFIPSRNDHFVSTNDGERDQNKHLRTLGWIYAEERPGTVPIYRCHNNFGQTFDHFVSTQADCESEETKTEFLLGYIYPYKDNL